MQPIVFMVQMFVDDSPEDHEDSRLKLLYMLEALTKCNQVYLARNPNTIKLYDSKVVYQPEFGTEEWQDIPTTLARGWGDCEDLAAFRCAELRHEGIHAMPHIRWRQVGKSWRFHALLQWPPTVDANGNVRPGRIEDPSRRLGMAKWAGYLSVKPTSQQF